MCSKSVPQEIPDKKRFISSSLILCLLSLSNDSFVTERLKEEQKINVRKFFGLENVKTFVTLTIKDSFCVLCRSSLKEIYLKAINNLSLSFSELCVTKSKGTFMDFFLWISFCSNFCRLLGESFSGVTLLIYLVAKMWIIQI